MAPEVLKGAEMPRSRFFQGAGFQVLIEDPRGRFAKVKVVESAASGARSPDMYLLAKDFRLV
jgi:23S rRNA U2552 (ribose-2'-O)-methylase RlmE/FtsJ